MKRGFFAASSLISKTRIPTTSRCGLCGWYKHCQSPKMPPTGKGKRKILVVAEAPGQKEDKLNTQLVGKAGQRLRKHLKRKGIDLDRDCWKTNAVICGREKNETPDDTTIECCRANLFATIKRYNPNAILLLGTVACKSLLTLAWKGDIGGITRWAGYQIPCFQPNSWIVPTYHPSYLVRLNSNLLDRTFERHLDSLKKKAKSKPKIVNYKDQIDIIKRPSVAAKEIKHMIRRGGLLAFDYEGTSLKPEVEGAEILTCSISWRGTRNIAFPWQAEVIGAMDKLTKSSLPKIASNIKFEDRWTRKLFNHPVRNWYWDTMLAAHIINNRRKVTSLKFQSFVLLGMECYDNHIEPFLKQAKGTSLNRIREIGLNDLLLYNGLDSLLEFEVARKQIKILERRECRLQ